VGSIFRFEIFGTRPTVFLKTKSSFFDICDLKNYLTEQVGNILMLKDEKDTLVRLFP
jgi:hypothetical protein